MNNRNDDWLKLKKSRKEQLTPRFLFDGIRSGSISALSAGITLIESSNPNHYEDAKELLQLCLPFTGNSLRIGITGVPGVGKSTFIESFGNVLLQHNKKVAVLAIDPSSSISHGSILGDKTRMQELSTRNDVFIRPSPAGDTLGGVAQKTRETILLCEAAGFNFILVETVGVGQSETVVKSMVDFFLLLMLSGAGDELQGIKKGIMEMADALIITKADGENEKSSELAAREYKNAMHLFHPNENEWIPQVFTCSAITGKNVDKVYEVISSFVNQVKLNGAFASNRKDQNKHWLKETLKELVLDNFFARKEVQNDIEKMIKLLNEDKTTSFRAADELFNKYGK